MDFQKNWNSFLDEGLSCAPNHFLWLKSLSYLEYIGYRKMVKALSYQEMNSESVHHLSDEIQHSFTLGKMAEALSNSLTSPLAPLLRKEREEKISQIAENYFQTLDSKIGEWVANLSGSENHHLSYLWVSYIIEKRAMKVYPHYFSKLNPSPLKTAIQKIIKDESEHLSYLEDSIRKIPEKYLKNSSDLFVFEEKLFSNYLEETKNCFVK